MAISFNNIPDTIRTPGSYAEVDNSRALQGLTRSLVANMVIGVNKGFERVLEINGIGYRATLSGNRIVFNLGYSHPIDFDLPEGISASIDRNNIIKLSGIDKEQLGHISAAIRRLRAPEPYKGKGIKYAEEYIHKKGGNYSFLESLHYCTVDRRSSSQFRKK